MALIHYDGFDLYRNLTDLSQVYTILNSDSELNPSIGRFGGGCYHNVSNSDCIYYVLPTPIQEFWTGFAFYAENSQANHLTVVEFDSASGIETVIVFNTVAAEVQAYRQNQNSTLIGSASASLSVSTWHWIDIHLKLHGSAGIVEVWQDNTRVLNLTGVNTSNTGATLVTKVALGTSNNNSYHSCRYDDLVLNDTTGSHNNGRIGDSRIETSLPNADAGINDGTPSSGSSHYVVVNEAQNNAGSTYITITNTSGQEELFNFANLSGTPATVLGVKITNWVEKTDAGTANGTSVLNSASTAVEGSSQPLMTAFSSVAHIYETDPNTTNPWTYSAVNAASGGFIVP